MDTKNWIRLEDNDEDVAYVPMRDRANVPSPANPASQAQPVIIGGQPMPGQPPDAFTPEERKAIVLQMLRDQLPPEVTVTDAELEELALRELANRSLRHFIPYATKGYSTPHHLAPLMDIMEDPVGKAVKCCVHAPPRHAKTDTLLAAIVRLMWKNPGLQVAYVCHSVERAKGKSRKAMIIAKRLGMKLDPAKRSAADWYTVDGCRFFATGVNGGIIGEGFDIIIVDDPVKTRVEAESARQRNVLWDLFNDDIETRLTPNGSIIVTMHRWHRDDLIGRLIENGWDYICLSAVAGQNDPYGRPEGSALWPEAWPLRLLEPKMYKRYTWAGIYQGNPKTKETEIFHDAHYYGGDTGISLEDFIYETGKDGVRKRKRLFVACGIDLAATAKQRADKSIAIVLVADETLDPIFVVYAVFRQVKTPVFVNELVRIKERYPGVKFCWHFSGMEKAVGQFIAKKGVIIDMQPARGDKVVRADPAADLWNAGRILVPQDTRACAWVKPLVENVVNFTGLDGEPDDPADGLASGVWKIINMVKQSKRKRYGRLIVH